MPKIIGHVKPGSWVSSDEYSVYKRLSRFGYVHRAVNDSMEESVDDDTHTNTIEGLWSHLKCSVRGTDRAMSPKHMMECLGEFEYRFNCRFDVARNLMFDRLIAAF